jgi:chromosome partitioning protein
MNHRKFIISFAQQKGGAGKSTVCVHLLVSLLWKYPDIRVGLIDMDSKQRTSYNFLATRSQLPPMETPDGKKRKLPMPAEYRYLTKSTLDSKEEAERQEEIEFYKTINDMDVDIVLIDTAGTIDPFASLAIKASHITCTPVGESVVDINSLLQLRKGKLVTGPFGSLVFDQIKSRLAQLGHNPNPQDSSWEWFFIITRAASIHYRQASVVLNILNDVIDKIGGNFVGYFHERTSYKWFVDGKTLVDDLEMDPLGELRTRRNLRSNKAAHGEVLALLNKVIKVYKKWLKLDTDIKFQSRISAIKEN